jgi:uncharacterized protein YchJ
MKTTNNINRIAAVTFASVTFLFATLMPMQAASGKNGNSEMNEIQKASKHLALFNNEIEKTVEFNAPVLSENFETAVAESRLEDLFGSLAGEAKYISPSVHEDFEAVDAMQNLVNLNTNLEASIRYTASVN